MHAGKRQALQTWVGVASTSPGLKSASLTFRVVVMAIAVMTKMRRVGERRKKNVKWMMGEAGFFPGNLGSREKGWSCDLCTKPSESETVNKGREQRLLTNLVLYSKRIQLVKLFFSNL